MYMYMYHICFFQSCKLVDPQHWIQEIIMVQSVVNIRKYINQDVDDFFFSIETYKLTKKSLVRQSLHKISLRLQKLQMKNF